MGARTSLGGKKTAGTHNSVTTGAVPVVTALRKLFPNIRVSNRIIEAGTGGKSFSIKIIEESGAKRMTVTANSAKQVFYLFNCPSADEVAQTLRGEKQLRKYFIRP